MGRTTAMAAMALLVGCGGGGSGRGEAAVTMVAGGGGTPAPAVATGAAAAAAAAGAGWALAAAALYDVAPDIANCRTGALKASVKAEVLARLNAIRALHRLAPVEWDDAADAPTAAAALILAANGRLSHAPPPDWACYSAVGAAGAGSSNLYGGTVSEWLGWTSDDEYLAGWLKEDNAAALGHRRWMLDPFLTRTAYGRVAQQLGDGRRTDAATLKVVDAPGARAPAALPPFVAWPYGDYPARYADPSAYLSFSVVLATRAASAAVDYDRATVTVTGPDGRPLAIGDRGSDHDGFGLPNNLRWRVAGLRRDVTYAVRIAGVVGAPQGDYAYSFRIGS